MTEGAYDSLFVPQVSFYTGDVDAHDLAISAEGECYFANTLFSCIAKTSQTHSFKPVWTPPFIDRLGLRIVVISTAWRWMQGSRVSCPVCRRPTSPMDGGTTGTTAA